MKKNHQYWLEEERRILRGILDVVMDNISLESKGHTPNWKKVMERVEKYEDNYSPLGDKQ